MKLISNFERVIDSRFGIKSTTKAIKDKIAQAYIESRDKHPAGITVKVSIYDREVK